MRKKKKKKRKLFDILRILVLLVALSVLLYPTISNYLYEKNSSKIVENYDDTMEKISEEKMREIIEQARAYNRKLVGSVTVGGDTFSTTADVPPQYEEQLNTEDDGMMGYVTIPKINVELPIYHGTSEAVLQVGVGHFASSSLPVGGETTHAVLTGHRGLPSKKLFTDLDKIVKGDIFYVKILNETLAYEVDQILTVLPEQTDALQIEKGKDYVTLVTCTPYAVNTHRLLIRGTRIPYEEAVLKTPDIIDDSIKIPFEVKVLGIGIFALIVMILIWNIAKKVRRKRG